jgi:outer membrane protein assembly factor BamB
MYAVRAFLLSLVLFFCSGLNTVRAEDWSQWLGNQRDGVWREEGILEKFPAGGPKVLWRKPIGGGYTGPAVVGDKVYVMDRVLEEGEKNPDNLFARSPVKGFERVLCFDAKKGDVLWTHKYPCEYRISYPAGPRCTPTVHEGKVYALGAMGDLFCLDAGKGAVLWSKSFMKEYKTKPAVWGWSSHPLIDGDKLICVVGGSGSLAVAFDKNTGQERWRSLTSTEQGYCPPMIFEIEGTRQLIVWDAEQVSGLDPEKGTAYWTVPFKLGAGMSISTPRLMNGNMLFLTCFYNGSMMLKVTGGDKPNATIAWQIKGANERRTEALHSVMVTPWIQDGWIYGVCSYGQLRCLKAETGERKWSTLKATTGTPKAEGKELRWANAFIVPHKDRYFLFNEKGELIIAKLTPEGYQEIDRAKILEPTQAVGGRDIVWVHPAFAGKCMFVRNDQEIVCISLAAE